MSVNPDTRKTYQYYKQKSGFTKNLEFHTKRIQNQTKSILILYWLFGKNKTFNRQTKFRVYRLTYFGMFGLDENRFKAFFHSMTIFLQTFKTLPLVFLQFTLNILNNFRHRLFKIKQKNIAATLTLASFQLCSMEYANNVSYVVTSLQLNKCSTELSIQHFQTVLNK